MVNLKKLTKVYTTKKDQEIIALENITLDLQDNGMVFFVGASGSGKSSLINIISGLDKKFEGLVIVGGINLSQSKSSQLDAFRNESIGYIFQDYCLIEDKSVYYNISLPLLIQGKRDDELVQSLIQKLGLEGLENEHPYELSGGQQQRVAIARALIKDPQIIVCDEPTGALDSKNAENFYEIVKEISKERLIIVVTHDLKYTKKYADRIIELSNGKIINDTNPFHIEKEFEPQIYNKSKFSFKETFKFSISNFKSHIVRLCFIIVLMILGITCFSISATIATYDKSEALLDSYYRDNVNFISLKKIKKDEDYPRIVEEDKQNIRNKFGAQVIGAFELNTSPSINAGHAAFHAWTMGQNILEKPDEQYYNNTSEKSNFSGFYELDDALVTNLDFKLIHGRMPTSYDEVCISKYKYETFLVSGYINDIASQITTEINNFSDLNMKKLYGNLKIVGVLDTKISKRYDEIKRYFKSNKVADERTSKLLTQMSEFQYSPHCGVFVNKGFRDNYFNTTNNSARLSEKKVKMISDLKSYDCKLFNKEMTTLTGNSVIMPESYVYDYYDLGPKIEQLITEYANENYLSDVLDGDGTWYKNYILENVINYFNQERSYSYFYNECISDALEKFQNEGKYVFTDFVNKVPIKYEIAGFYDGEYALCAPQLSETLIKEYRLFSNPTLLVQLTGNRDKDLKIINEFIGYKNDFKIYDDYRKMLEFVDNSSSAIAIIAIATSVLFLLVSFFLLINYVTNSIIDKKETIGVLRAVGMSKFAITKIFIIQMLFLLLCILIPTIVLSFIGVNTYNYNINYFCSSNILLPKYKIYFSFISLLIMILTTFLGLVFPIRKNIFKEDPLVIIREGER